MTLLELVVAAMITIIFAVVLPQFAIIRNSWDSKQGAAEALQNGRVLMDHLDHNLSKAVRIAAVSESSVTDGYVEFIDNDGNVRYDIGTAATSVRSTSSLSDWRACQFAKFTCYDACDLNTPSRRFRI
jgi:type II secretory pathway pseudopilin PulG